MFRLTDDEQAKVTSRQLSVVAVAITSRNLMAVLLAVSFGVTAYALHGWRVASLAARENVHIFHSVERGGLVSAYDELPDLKGPVSWAEGVIKAKLMDFAHWRYNKVRTTIRDDLSKGEYFLSPDLVLVYRGKNKDAGHFDAPGVAAEHAACRECADIEATPNDVEVLSVNAEPLVREYGTTYQYGVLLTLTTVKAARVLATEYKRLTVQFRLLNEREQAKKITELNKIAPGKGIEYFRVNTPGVEILSYVLAPDYSREAAMSARAGQQ